MTISRSLPGLAFSTTGSVAPLMARTVDCRISAALRSAGPAPGGTAMVADGAPRLTSTNAGEAAATEGSRPATSQAPSRTAGNPIAGANGRSALRCVFTR